jgi:UDP-N-acetylmuramoyl-tripeptide--D-alanyl-D-alanine ligase
LIIDDAYSSNPEGVKAAVRLVNQLAHRPKIIVTPGLVELGSRQAEENAHFGRLIAANFDYAVLVNRTNRAALLKGLAVRSNLQEKTPPTAGPAGEGSTLKKYFVTDSLAQATQEILPRLVQPGCLVLFENDLPDIYA